MHSDIERFPPYRWVVLGLAWLVVVCMVLSWFMIPSLAHLLFPELKLTHAQFTLIFTAPFLVGIFISIPGGALGDRVGIRLVVALAAFLMGIASLARAGAPSFGAMFALMCVWGVAYGVVMPNLPKLVGIWFPPREAGLASGIYTSALNVGAALGLFTGPMFSGLKPAFLTVGALMLVAAILWALCSRSAPSGVTIKMPPMLAGIKRGIASRNVWLISIGMGLFMGAFGGFSGNLPVALGKVHGVDPKTAGIIASLCTCGMALGNFLLPLLSDKLGRRKAFVYPSALVSAVCFFVAWYFAPGTITWFFIVLGGFVFGSIQPLLFTILVELPEIGPECMGGASGVVTTFLNGGGFFIPLLVISPLVAASTLAAYTSGFFVTAVLIASIALVMLFVMETGQKARASA